MLRLVGELLRTTPTPFRGDQALRRALRLIPTDITCLNHDDLGPGVAFSVDGTPRITASPRRQGPEWTFIQHRVSSHFSPKGAAT